MRCKDSFRSMNPYRYPTMIYRRTCVDYNTVYLNIKFGSTIYKDRLQHDDIRQTGWYSTVLLLHHTLTFRDIMKKSTAFVGAIIFSFQMNKNHANILHW